MIRSYAEDGDDGNLLWGGDIRQDEVKGRWNPTMAEPLQLGVMQMPHSLTEGKVLDALERDGFIGQHRPQVPAWKAKAGR